MNKWISVKDKLPDIDKDSWILGYSLEWIDEDFNPEGIRICSIYGDGTQFVSAKWFDYQDTFDTDWDIYPTHWMRIPKINSKSLLQEIYEFAKQPATNKMEILDMIEKKIKEETI